ncbi:hypothetical protein MJ579_10295 [Klebsiella pneumoniae]|nr:hypothetical protein MJ579_10295 [Klebsiella pneumoniae]
MCLERLHRQTVVAAAWLRMHVVDGAIKYVETDNTGDDNYDGLHQVRACPCGRSMRRRVYNPDRV